MLKFGILVKLGPLIKKEIKKSIHQTIFRKKIKFFLVRFDSQGGMDSKILGIRKKKEEKEEKN